MLRTVAVLLAVTLLAALVLAEGESVEPKTEALDLIEKGRIALVAGNGLEAVEHLQKAIGIIQEMAIGGIKSFFPKVFEGFTAKEPEAVSGSWGSGRDQIQWNQASRGYRRTEDGASVDIVISTSPQMVEGQRAGMKAYQNPEMLKVLNMDPNRTFEIFDDGSGWVGYLGSQKGGSASGTVMHERVLVMFSVSTDDLALLKRFLAAMDLAGLAKATAPSKAAEKPAEK